MGTILHITTPDVWWEAKQVGRYEPESLRTEGFIHCATPEQVTDVADRLYRGRMDLILLYIEEDHVKPEVRYEPSVDGTGVYPHIYGPLDVTSVMGALPFPCAPDGTFTLPR